MSFYVDLWRYKPKTLTAQQGQPVEHLFECAEQLKLPALPVSGVIGGRRPEYFDAVRRIAAARRGAALRMFIRDFAIAAEAKAHALGTVEMLNLDPANIELLLDFGSRTRTLQYADQQLSNLVQYAVEAVQPIGFRAIVVCGTSVPEQVGSKYNTAPFRAKRIELDIWHKVSASVTKELVRFGDYGVMTPYQPDGGASSRPPKRIRLASRAEVVSFRADSLPNDAYRRLCTSVIADKAFGAQTASWGRGMIATSSVVQTTGDPSEMVARDTNMHIETTLSLIEQHAKPMVGYANLQLAEPDQVPEQADAFEEETGGA
jgi:hypothetical protein